MLGVKLNPRQFLDRVAEELARIDESEVQALAEAVWGCYEHGRLGSWLASRRVWLLISIVNNLALLLFFKYARFVVENLNQLLADTITLRDLYQKHHWQASGPTFYQLHLLFDKHRGEQGELAAVGAREPIRGGGRLIGSEAAHSGQSAQRVSVEPHARHREGSGLGVAQQHV